jgi:hypothetical protein
MPRDGGLGDALERAREVEALKRGQREESERRRFADKAAAEAAKAAAATEFNAAVLPAAREFVKRAKAAGIRPDNTGRRWFERRMWVLQPYGPNVWSDGRVGWSELKAGGEVVRDLSGRGYSSARVVELMAQYLAEHGA